MTNEVDCNPIYDQSEEKRLKSLKEKKYAFKRQEKIIRDALNLSDHPTSKKIKFDDFDLENIDTPKNEGKKDILFGNDDEEETVEWNEKELEAKSVLKQKLGKLQASFGNDKRFVLDDRFLDDQVLGKEEEKNNEGEEINEKEWQLDILGNVLGKPLKNTDDKNQPDSKKKIRMIRYDPTATDHKNYEVNAEKPEEEKPSKKKKKKVEEKAEEPVPVSTELFFSVSDQFVEAVKHIGEESSEFSLLKTLGRETLNDEKQTKKQDKATVEISDGGFQFNFEDKQKRNPFKYDSSDSEEDDETDLKYTETNPIEVKILPQKSDRLFFKFNDERFQEAVQFFKKQALDENDDFKSKRREMKQIVRYKIRNNLKKSNSLNRKKVRKMFKSKGKK